MTFTIIDMEQWSRKNIFSHYAEQLPCTYSMTVKLDITPIREKSLRIYPALLYAITTVVNRYEEFRISCDATGRLGVYSEMMPCYTVFNKETMQFTNVWTAYQTNFFDFCVAYEKDVADYGNSDAFMGKPGCPDNTFPVSAIPWTSFEGFNLNLQKGYGYFLPIFTIGKFYNEGKRVLLPFATQVHHAVCDGFHLSRFLNELQMVLKEI